MPDELKRRAGSTVSATIQRLESLERAGVRLLPRAKRKSAPAAAVVAASVPPATTLAPDGLNATAAVNHAPQVIASPPTDPTDSLAIIREEVAQCSQCGELAGTRTQTVFGVGNPRARLCFLGEAPGADEDRLGEPFVGRAGQLLTKIIEACKLARSDVYILNVLKCRPPGNRNPLPHEVSNCRGFLDRQLSLIRPDYICCLGSVAAQTLLQTDTAISRMRGKFFDYRGISVMCTYHPAYLLRNPSAKKEVWEDMKVLMAKMGIELA
jgi:uracil-DNA glycosylase